MLNASSNVFPSISPKVSVITASLNSGEYIEETIRSVANQTYDNIEYIVIEAWLDPQPNAEKKNTWSHI